MVTNSFGKRNFCSQWEGPSRHSRCLAFFPFKFGVGRIFFHFSLGSQYVLTMFPLSSQWELPSIFPKFLMYSPTCSPQHLTFIPYALAMLSSFQVYVSAKGKEFHCSYQKLLVWLPLQFHFHLSDGPIKLVGCKKTQIELGRHLIQLIGEVKGRGSMVEAVLCA